MSKQTMKRAPRGLFVFLLACSPALLAAKCVDYDPRYGGGAPAPVGDAGSTPGAVVPAEPCGEANTALMKVQNRQFVIQCGCVETQGKVCTVGAGTTVRWQFADADDHNISSSMMGFKSGEMSAGIFEVPFASAGTYGYGCSIHSDMRGYSIVVR